MLLRQHGHHVPHRRTKTFKAHIPPIGGARHKLHLNDAERPESPRTPGSRWGCRLRQGLWKVYREEELDNDVLGDGV